MSASTPTPDDAYALDIDSPALSWINLDLPTIVNMTVPQPHESILVLGCATGELLVGVLKAPEV